MNKLITILIVTFAINQSLTAQNNKLIYSDSVVTCSYSIRQGMLNGKYTSWYKNGVKKSEGEFYSNNRIGTWKAWDNSGNLKAKRTYKNNLSYKRYVPKIPKDKTIKLLKQFPITPHRNDESFYEYYNLQEKNVIYCNRYIGIILPDNNQLLFLNENILEFFVKNQDVNNLMTYRIFDGYQAHKPEIESIENLKLIAFKTSQELVFDFERLIMEPRIIFLSPVFVDTLTNKLYDDNWYYYNDILPHLAKLSIDFPDGKLDIKNVSDIFFWHRYSDNLVRNYYFSQGEKDDIKSSAFLNEEEMSELLTESEACRIKEIEREHDLWIKFTKNHESTNQK